MLLCGVCFFLFFFFDWLPAGNGLYKILQNYHGNALGVHRAQFEVSSYMIKAKRLVQICHTFPYVREILIKRFQQKQNGTAHFPVSTLQILVS